MLAVMIMIMAALVAQAQDVPQIESVYDYEESLLIKTKPQEVAVKIVLNNLPRMVVSRYTIFVVNKNLVNKDSVQTLNCMVFDNGEAYSELSNTQESHFKYLIKVVATLTKK